ncbi:MAG: uroporphyrinogen-III C-methyltransferase [Porticoccaceae bacterium]|nr:uroporphyrinogen-III C-methyltransferase [Porticoccaceae bacterium]
MTKTPLTLVKNTGQVSLVGAGPGDPDLITVKAMRLLQCADAIVYDRLANPVLLDYAPAHCQLIHVGKQKDRHTLPQDDINQLLVKLALQGKNVVRLKGGDPFIFGRGGEELDQLHRHNIRCQVVPGITAATGCAAALQIPLTHRDHAHALTFITAHRQNDSLSLNWDLVMQNEGTVVFYMGLANLGKICDELLQRGCPAQKPIAVIANGTTANQQTVVGTVSTIVEKLEKTPLPSPALIVLGDVVNANHFAHTQAQLCEQALLAGRNLALA